MTDEELYTKNTKEYIDTCLNPNHVFKQGTKYYQKIKQIMSYADVIYNDIVADYIQNMSYNDFLLTPYWEAVRCYMFKKYNFKCALCGKNGQLNVHHKNYEKHGYEHIKSIADDTLIVLCNNCHAKFHDKI